MDTGVVPAPASGGARPGPASISRRYDGRWRWREGWGGRVSEVNFRGSHDQPKLVPIDKQSDDEVMHLNRFRKTDCLTGQSLDPGSQPQVFTFNLLRVSFARLVLSRLEMTRVGPIIIRVITLDPKW